MQPETDFSAACPYESHFVEVLGSRMHYLEQGEGSPILLLLDQRDDRTLSALQVTPLSSGYFAYRIGLPMPLSLPMTVLALRLSGLPPIGLGRELITAAIAAPLAPAFALFLGSFAGNKVQGFALMKAAGVIYWPAKVYWDLAAGSASWLPLLFGTLYLAALNTWLLRRFERVIRR